MDENSDELLDSVEEEAQEEEATEEVAEEEEVEETSEPVDVRESQEFKDVLARAKKAEAALKDIKSKPEAAPQNINSDSLSAEDVDTKILQSQGMSEELIGSLKDIAKVKGISILAAQEDEIFKVIKDKAEKADKNAKASLGASKGSGQIKGRKNTTTPNLKAEEHKDMWKAQRDD